MVLSWECLPKVNGMAWYDASSMDSEMGLPILLDHSNWFNGIDAFLPFSAILSTADSCLMAASGNIVTDILAKFSKGINQKSFNFHK
jgi:Na+/proline symporter